jgi:hypothetical protein
MQMINAYLPGVDVGHGVNGTHKEGNTCWRKERMSANVAPGLVPMPFR